MRQRFFPWLFFAIVIALPIFMWWCGVPGSMIAGSSFFLVVMAWTALGFVDQAWLLAIGVVTREPNRYRFLSQAICTAATFGVGGAWFMRHGPTLLWVGLWLLLMLSLAPVVRWLELRALQSDTSTRAGSTSDAP